MLKYQFYKVFEADEVFNEVKKEFGYDPSEEFGEYYCPPQSGCVYFYIPNTCEDYDDLREYEKYICAILREQGGMNWGDSCYLSVDY